MPGSDRQPASALHGLVEETALYRSIYVLIKQVNYDSKSSHVNFMYTSILFKHPPFIRCEQSSKTVPLRLLHCMSRPLRPGAAALRRPEGHGQDGWSHYQLTSSQGIDRSRDWIRENCLTWNGSDRQLQMSVLASAIRLCAFNEVNRIDWAHGGSLLILWAYLLPCGFLYHS